MPPELLPDMAHRALWVLLLAAAPALVPALVVGVLLGLVQAATSINEATLTFVPKLVAVAACLVLFGGLIAGLLADFTTDLFAEVARVSARE